MVDIVISDEKFEKSSKYEYKPKKVQAQLTNMIVYDSKTVNIDRVIPSAKGIFRLS